MKSLMTTQEAAELIRAGKKLLISGDETLLAALPRGEWIGGTIPYFMSEEGGLCTHERLQVAVLPDFAESPSIKMYSSGQLSHIPADYKPNGFSYIVLPAFSEAHLIFAQECSGWPGIFDRPLLGWIAGINLKDLGRLQPKVFNGQTGESTSTQAAVMNVDLPVNKFARVNILNLFEQGDGDIIAFPTEGFSATDCFVNGRKRNLAEYLESQAIGMDRPLVADYMGAMINVSFQKVDRNTGRVDFYAPVFTGVEYKVAAPLGDYEERFGREIAARNVDPVFSCNCILNYLYANLEGKKTGSIVGPITFGEIAYMLLNQTMVYLTFEDK